VAFTDVRTRSLYQARALKVGPIFTGTGGSSNVGREDLASHVYRSC
jgi:hypothetical protein